MQFNTYTVADAHIATWLVNNPSPGAPALAAVLGSYDVHQPVTTRWAFCGWPGIGAGGGVIGCSFPWA
jgi:hypothetical protein